MARAQSKFLALLRGINVGGKNIIAKDDLRTCFENLGFTGVRTYIQSGNVLFHSENSRARELTAQIERGLSKHFSYEAQAVVFSHRKYKSAMLAAPQSWGRSNAHKHNAIFTLQGVSPQKVLAFVAPPDKKLETITLGPGVVFWSALKEQLTKSTYMKLAKDPIYQQVTIRNHNTALKLLELLEEA